MMAHLYVLPIKLSKGNNYFELYFFIVNDRKVTKLKSSQFFCNVIFKYKFTEHSLNIIIILHFQY